MDNKSFIAIGLSTVAIVVAILVGLFSGGAAPVAGNTTASFWDTANGYKVDGTTIIDGSGLYAALLTANAGTLHSYPNSTSTTATAQNLAVADLAGYDTVILTPNVGTVTLTFFASSTASTWLPTAGDTQHTCLVNGTTTAATYIVVAGGTGTKIQVASSSTATLGSLQIGPQKAACFDFVRGNATGSTFDILGLMTAYQ